MQKLWLYVLETEATNTQAQALYERMGLNRVSGYFYALDL